MSFTYPHISNLTSMSTSAATTQSNLEALIAAARADPASPSHRELATARRRRSSVLSRASVEERRALLRQSVSHGSGHGQGHGQGTGSEGRASGRRGHGHGRDASDDQAHHDGLDTAIDDGETEIDMDEDERVHDPEADAQAQADRERADGAGRGHRGRYSWSSAKSGRRSSAASGGGPGRLSRLATIPDRREVSGTSSVGEHAEPASASAPATARRSRSRSISRARLAAVAAGDVPGFSPADLGLAAETNAGVRLPRGSIAQTDYAGMSVASPRMGGRASFASAHGRPALNLASPRDEHEPLLGTPHTGHTHGFMELDPAEELDPVLDLGLPCDKEGEVVEDWRAAFKSELPILIRTAGPIFITQVAEYSLVLASVISIGHLSTTDLAASSLASMTASVTCFSILQGMASALDTLLPAAWTSEDPTRVGLWTQRMIIVTAVAMIPMYFVWWQAEGLLLLLRQEPAVAARASLYLRALSIGIPGYALNTIMKKYFQAQGLFKAPTIVISVVAPLNAFLNWLLVWGPKPIRLGFIGAPLATGIGFNVAALVSVAYAVFFAPRAAWGGINFNEAFRKLGTVTSLGLAGTIQVSSEWWAWEACALAASLLGPVVLACQSILLSCGSVLFQVPASLGVATSVRVGNLLGAGRSYEAKWASRSALVLSILTSLVNSALLVIFRGKVAYLFNNDPEVVALVAKVAIWVALFQVADGLVGTTGGVLRAVGKQSAGALINLTAYYVLGLPLGIWLCFDKGQGLVGLWLGLTLSLVYASAASCWIIWRVDWVKAVDKARARLGLGALPADSKAEDVPVTYGTMHA